MRRNKGLSASKAGWNRIAARVVGRAPEFQVSSFQCSSVAGISTLLDGTYSGGRPAAVSDETGFGFEVEMQ